MHKIPSVIQKLMEELERLPGIGPKSAARLTYYLIGLPKERLSKLSDILSQVKDTIKPCSICGHIDDQDPCRVCSDDSRDAHVLCVVEDSLDLLAFERLGEYEGKYHVLGGVINPVAGIGPEHLRIESLIKRMKETDFEEIIIATNPSIEGEATASYIKQDLDESKISIKVTRLARGLPSGADLEYADQTTLKRAFEGRKEF